MVQTTRMSPFDQMDLVTRALVDAGEFRQGAGFELMYYPDEDHLFKHRKT